VIAAVGRLSAIRIARSSRLWLSLGVWCFLALAFAVFARRDGWGHGADRVLSSFYGGLALPFMACAVARAAFGGRSMTSSTAPLVALGVSPVASRTRVYWSRGRRDRPRRSLARGIGGRHRSWCCGSAPRTRRYRERLRRRARRSRLCRLVCARDDDRTSRRGPPLPSWCRLVTRRSRRGDRVRDPSRPSAKLARRRFAHEHFRAQ
jgi:hypothetical protein